MMGSEKVLDTGRAKGPDPRRIYPVRAQVRTEEKDGKVVLVYPKDFSRFERKLHAFIGGPTDIRRPLDDVGSMLWRMSDGQTDLLSIYIAEQEAFRERVEPVDRVVGGLLETMLKLGLMSLEYRDEGGSPIEREASRIITRSPKER
jgi:hypothetical protein